MKKTIYVLLSLTLALSLLPACGSQGAAEVQTTPAAETSQEPAVEVTATPEVEVTAVPTEAAAPLPQETETPAVQETEAAAQQVLFTPCDETVYANSTVNVRAGYSTDADKLGSLSQGQAVERVGMGVPGTEAENWSKVEFNGVEAYIYSEYLSTTKPAATTSNKTSSTNSQSKSDTSTGTNEKSSSANSSTQYDDPDTPPPGMSESEATSSNFGKQDNNGSTSPSDPNVTMEIH